MDQSNIRKEIRDGTIVKSGGYGTLHTRDDRHFGYRHENGYIIEAHTINENPNLEWSAK